MIHRLIIADENGLVMDDVLDAIEFTIDSDAQIDFVFNSNINVFGEFPKPKKIVINKSGTKQIHLDVNPSELLKFFDNALDRNI